MVRFLKYVTMLIFSGICSPRLQLNLKSAFVQEKKYNPMINLSKFTFNNTILT